MSVSASINTFFSLFSPNCNKNCFKMSSARFYVNLLIIILPSTLHAVIDSEIEKCVTKAAEKLRGHDFRVSFQPVVHSMRLRYYITTLFLVGFQRI